MSEFSILRKFLNVCDNQLVNYTSSDYNILTNNGISFTRTYINPNTNTNTNSYNLTIGSSYGDIATTIRISKLENIIQIYITKWMPSLSSNRLTHSKKEFIIHSTSIEEYDDLELCAIIGRFLLNKNLSLITSNLDVSFILWYDKDKPFKGKVLDMNIHDQKTMVIHTDEIDESLLDNFDTSEFYIIRNISKIRNIILEKYKNVYNEIDDNFAIGRNLDLTTITFSFRNSYFLFSSVDLSSGNFLLDQNVKTSSYKTNIPKSLLDDIDNNSYSDVEICLKYGRDFLDTSIDECENLILIKELFSIILRKYL